MKRRLRFVLVSLTMGLAAAAIGSPLEPAEPRPAAVILISANAEWAAVKALFPAETYERSAFGEFFHKTVTSADGKTRPVIVFFGGWGKVSAAASAQYVLDRWKPDLLFNLGTCGGFAGAIERGTIILVDRTVIYDVIERMSDPDETILEMSTTIDLSWLRGPLPAGVKRMPLVSADQDLDPAAIPRLRAKYGAAAADWESGAIAYVAAKNKTRVLILRGVTDLVGASGGEAYGKIEVFEQAAKTVMSRLFADLPLWLAAAGR